MAKEHFKIGRRYPISFEKAEAVKPHLNGETLDLSLGTRCVSSISWRCWTLSGKSADISITREGEVLSVQVSDAPDDERPPAFR